MEPGERPPQRLHHFPRRPRRLVIRLSEDEAAAVKEAAATEHCSVTTFVLGAVKARAEVPGDLPRRGPAPDGQVLRALLQQVNALWTEAARQGNNLNQIAHALNAGHDQVAGEAVQVARRSTEILDRMGELVTRLRDEFGIPTA
jgi:predicted HicB family RNase H-like nuclease